MIDQTTLGHRFLRDEFGVRPKVTWQMCVPRSAVFVASPCPAPSPPPSLRTLFLQRPFRPQWCVDSPLVVLPRCFQSASHVESYLSVTFFAEFHPNVALLLQASKLLTCRRLARALPPRTLRAAIMPTFLSARRSCRRSSSGRRAPREEMLKRQWEASSPITTTRLPI